MVFAGATSCCSPYNGLYLAQTAARCDPALDLNGRLCRMEIDGFFGGRVHDRRVGRRSYFAVCAQLDCA